MTATASSSTYLAIALAMAAGYAGCSEPTQQADDSAPIGVQTSNEAAARDPVPAYEPEQPPSAHPPFEQEPGPSLAPDPPSIEPSIAPTPVPIASCDVPDTFIEAQTDCAELPQSERFALPKVGPYPIPWAAGKIAEHIRVVDDTLYYSVLATLSCSGSAGGGTCPASPDGIYRKRNNSEWERIVEQYTPIFAANELQLYWAHARQGQELQPATINRVPTDTTTSIVATISQRDEYYMSLAVASGWLFSTSWLHNNKGAILERRAQHPVRLGHAEPLFYFENGIGTLKANEQRLVWTQTDPMVLVVANLNGEHQYVAALPHDTTRRRIEITDRFAFVMLEREPSSDADQGRSYSICELDLETGSARILVLPRYRTSIRAIAASSTHLSWSQTVQGDGDRPYQLWTQPLDGSRPRALACLDRPIPALYADDGHVYWIANDEMHRVDPKAL